jgi:hypothetical protein
MVHFIPFCDTRPTAGRRSVPRTPLPVRLRPPLYNRRVRVVVIFAALLSLAACNRGERNSEAIRQGVLDHLSSSSLGLNMSGMDVALTEVHTSGSQADVTASISPKGSPAGNGMSIKYHLEQRNSKWVVTGKQDAGGGAPHGAMPPGGAGANPHGGSMPGEAMPGDPHGGVAAQGGAPGKMPSPDDLPPTGKK